MKKSSHVRVRFDCTNVGELIIPRDKIVLTQYNEEYRIRISGSTDFWILSKTEYDRLSKLLLTES